MAAFIVIWTEAIDARGRVVFQWNGKEVLAEDAFLRLQSMLESAKTSKTKINLVIKGRLGQDVQWESSIVAHVKQATRQVFTRWYTQAVQAQAALVRQRVRRPAFE